MAGNKPSPDKYFYRVVKKLWISICHELKNVKKLLLLLNRNSNYRHESVGIIEWSSIIQGNLNCQTQKKWRRQKKKRRQNHHRNKGHGQAS